MKHPNRSLTARRATLGVLGVLVAGVAQAQSTKLDPAGSNPILNAVMWLQGTLLGNVATALAVLAVGATGLMMLTGRIDWRAGRHGDPGLLHRLRRRRHRRRHPLDLRRGLSRGGPAGARSGVHRPDAAADVRRA